MISRLSIPSSLQEELEALGTVDLVIGIPSFNRVHTLPAALQVALAGLEKHFPGQRAVAINSDGGYTDGIPYVVGSQTKATSSILIASHSVDPIHHVSAPFRSIPNRARALRLVFETAVLLNAKACAMVDADLQSVDPARMNSLLSPVLRDGFDFVSPLYLRHKYDAAIINSIIYPLFRSLYGQRIRQPIGWEFGFSVRLARHCLEQDIWEGEVARSGIDAWITTSASAEPFRVCQAFLGARTHESKGPGDGLSQMLRQVVGTVFSIMELSEEAWKGVRGSRVVPLFGQDLPVCLEPIRVDPDRMVRIFRTGLRDLESVWGRILRSDVAASLAELEDGSPGAFRFPPDLWIRAIHDFAIAFHHRTIDREHLLQALVPLYLGRVASFVRETEDASAHDVEVVHEQLCLRFEALKPELIQLWNAHGRTP